MRRSPLSPLLRASRRAGLCAVAVLALLSACAGLAPRPLPPKVDVEGVRMVLAATGEPRFRVLLDVHNPNAYAIAIDAIEARIRLEDQEVATANLPAPATLAAAGDTQVEVEARPDLAALQIALARVLRKLSGHYQVTGYAVVQDGIRLDFKRDGDLPLAALLGRLP